MAKRYARLNWNSTTTYVSAENLNVMDKGIKDLDTSLGDVATLKTTAKTVVPAINEINNNLGTNLKIEVGSVAVTSIAASSTTSVTITFTKQFTNAPKVFCNCAGWSADVFANADPATKTTVTVYIRNVSTTEKVTNLQYLAVGI